MARFSVAETLALADRVTLEPPAKSRIVRPEPRGELVFRFALPLELCLTGNPRGKAAAWQHAKVKRLAYELMRVQWLQQAPWRWPHALPLQGRPQVICLRLSSVEPDYGSNWSKVAVDMLGPPTGKAKRGLSVLVDDRPELADVTERWEPGPKGGGGCVFWVWTG